MHGRMNWLLLAFISATVGLAAVASAAQLHPWSEIDTSGSIGIGIASALAKLHVRGNFLIDTTAGIVGLFQDSFGKVGIGTTAPQAKFHVSNGDAIFDNSVGIGKVPTQKLDVNGQIKSNSLDVASQIKSSSLDVSGQVVANQIKGNSGICIGSDCRTNWPQLEGTSPTSYIVDPKGTRSSISMADSSTGYIAYLYRNSPSDSTGSLRVAKTTNGGSSWTVTNGGNAIDSGISNNPSIISAYAVDSNTVYVTYATKSGSTSTVKLAKTTNGGGSWSITTIDSINDVLGGGCQYTIYYYSATSIAISGSNAYAAYSLIASGCAGGTTSVKVAKSANSGSSWGITNGGNPLPSLAGVPSVAMLSSSTVLVASINSVGCYNSPCSGYIARTTDSGSSWSSTNIVAANSIVLSAADPNVVYAAYGAGYYSIYYFTYAYGIAKSTDAGSTWATQNLEQGLFSMRNGGYISHGSVKALDANTVYAVYQSDGLNVVRTTNGGNNWLPVNADKGSNAGTTTIDSKGGKFFIAYDGDPLKVSVGKIA